MKATTSSKNDTFSQPKPWERRREKVKPVEGTNDNDDESLWVSIPGLPSGIQRNLRTGFWRTKTHS
jgi:hypothetical protein